MSNVIITIVTNIKVDRIIFHYIAYYLYICFVSYLEQYYTPTKCTVLIIK